MTLRMDRQKYERAEAFLPWNVSAAVRNASLRPFWLPSSKKFWYRAETIVGHEFRLFDIDKGAVEPAFDHAALAALLGKTDSTAVAGSLPFEEITLDESTGDVLFEWRQSRWAFRSSLAELQHLGQIGHGPGDNVSPDYRWALRRLENDLWLRAVDGTSEVEKRLTTNGVEFFAYAKSPDSSTNAVTALRTGQPARAIAIWSPDSTKVFTYQLDERSVGEMNVVQSVTPNNVARPRRFSYRYPLVGDANIAMAHLCAINIETGIKVDAQCDPLMVPYLSPIELQLAWWGEDSRFVYVISLGRGEREARLLEFDAVTGHVRRVLAEHTDTFLDFNPEFLARPNVRVLQASREIIWCSQRDGWAHLYLYDLDSGQLKYQITSGSWVVRDILAIDPVKREMIVAGCGREKAVDPYLRSIYRISMDMHFDPVLLTPEPLDHAVTQAIPGVPTVLNPSGQASNAAGISPDGYYFVESLSSANVAPYSLLRTTKDGSVLAVLERVDMHELDTRGWRWPEPFTLRDSTDSHDLYGTLFLPPELEPNRKYPVIESIYPGPQLVWTAKNPFVSGRTFVADAYFHARALSELGFVVLTIDGPGTPQRSKEFHDECFGNMQAVGGLKEHIHAINALALSRTYMDLDRVGIYGHSGGGFAATRAMLDFPNFYKAAVASASVNDMRCYLSFWAEKYQGDADTADFAVLSNCERASQLSGPLLMVTSDVDDNTSPSMTIKMAEALIRENKDFELLIIPNESHMSLIDNAYFTRRLWDFFVRNLNSMSPPENYRIADRRRPS